MFSIICTHILPLYHLMFLFDLGNIRIGFWVTCGLACCCGFYDNVNHAVAQICVTNNNNSYKLCDKILVCNKFQRRANTPRTRSEATNKGESGRARAT